MQSHLHEIYCIVCFDTFLQKACYMDMEQKIYYLFNFSM